MHTIQIFIDFQLGTIPQESKKALEGKLVKYKNMKRVIKLPTGRQAIVEIPTEVLSFPQVHMSAEDEEEAEQQVNNFFKRQSNY